MNVERREIEMLKPETAGEYVELILAGRQDEIDPDWLQEVQETSYLLLLAMGALPAEPPEKARHAIASWRNQIR